MYNTVQTFSLLVRKVWTMMKQINWICFLLACTGEWLANRDTWKVLTKIHLSKSIQVTAHTEHTHTHLETPHTMYEASENIKKWF